MRTSKRPKIKYGLTKEGVEVLNRYESITATYLA